VPYAATAAYRVGTDPKLTHSHLMPIKCWPTHNRNQPIAEAGPTSKAHCDGAPIHYERHRLEQAALYRMVQQHAQSFCAQTEAATGAGLSQFVRDEFDAF